MLSLKAIFACLGSGENDYSICISKETVSESPIESFLPLIIAMCLFLDFEVPLQVQFHLLFDCTQTIH